MQLVNSRGVVGGVVQALRDVGADDLRRNGAQRDLLVRPDVQDVRHRLETFHAVGIGLDAGAREDGVAEGLHNLDAIGGSEPISPICLAL